MRIVGSLNGCVTLLVPFRRSKAKPNRTVLTAGCRLRLTGVYCIIRFSLLAAPPIAREVNGKPVSVASKRRRGLRGVAPRRTKVHQLSPRLRLLLRQQFADAQAQGPDVLRAELAEVDEAGVFA